MKFALFNVICVILLVMVTGCSKTHRKAPLEYVPHMADSPAVKAQHLGPFGEGMRVPPEGTLSQTGLPAYAYANDPEGAGRELKNPLERTWGVLEKGQKVFNNFCIVCHGPKAEGDGLIIPKFPRPPTLHTEKVAKQWSDGRIFHVITIGQNLMPSYASQLEPEERWAVIHYLRELQRAMPIVPNAPQTPTPQPGANQVTVPQTNPEKKI